MCDTGQRSAPRANQRRGGRIAWGALLLAAVAVFEVSLARGAGWIMFDAVLVAVGFTLLSTKRAPAWAVVLGTGSLVAAVLTLT